MKHDVRHLPTPKNSGQSIIDQFSPNDGTKTGSMQARNTNSSVKGPCNNQQWTKLL